MPFALAIVPVRKISSARHIVDKLKINAMHARSLNMFCFAMNFFAAIDESFDTAFVLRSRDITVMMPGMSAQPRSISYPQTHGFRPASCGLLAVGD
jgi:hypothetical protein